MKDKKVKIALGREEVKGLIPFINSSFSLADIPFSDIDRSEFGKPVSFKGTFTPGDNYNDLLKKYEETLDELLVPGTPIRMTLTADILAIGKIGEDRRSIVDVEFVKEFDESNG